MPTAEIGFMANNLSPSTSEIPPFKEEITTVDVGRPPSGNFFKNKKNLLMMVGIILLAFSLSGGVFFLKERKEVRMKAYNPEYDQYWDWCFWCLGAKDPCGRTSDYKEVTDSLIAITRKGYKDHEIEHLRGPSFGPEGSCRLGDAKDVFKDYPVSCTSLQKDQFYSGYGAASIKVNNDVNCDDCIAISEASFNEQGLKIVAVGYSEFPKTNYLRNCPSGIDDPNKEGCASIDLKNSALRFRFDLSGPVSRSSGEVISSCSPDAGTQQTWAILGHDPRAKRIICRAEYVFSGVTPQTGLKVSAVVKNPVVSGDQFPSQANDNCQKDVLVVPLNCADLTRNPTGPVKPGDELTFTCTHSGSGWHHYNFRYKSNLHEDWEYGPPESGFQNNTNGSVTYVVPPETWGATYTFECQACTVDNQCTSWGNAN